MILQEPIARLCEGKPRDALLFGGGLDYLQRPRSSGKSRSWFVTALDDAGLERMTVHDLRHTAASLAISSGANVKAVQRMLGHASAAMTLDVYADLFRRRSRHRLGIPQRRSCDLNIEGLRQSTARGETVDELTLGSGGLGQ
ncbi:tyrosine-type recombinase/integrase [Micromonospora sp. DT81.3]|uniref:tyrosine-type recombinase/integrase n=1 Tax=Micromonospora sp. DT81.3 TaxID=3416523 RepID=UPI003CF59831